MELPLMGRQQLTPEEAWQQHRDAIEHAYRFHEGVDVEWIARQTFDDGHADALGYPQGGRR